MEKRCIECYSVDNIITPLLKPLECLENHTQYICGNCGRCICIEYKDTQVKKLSAIEIEKYMSERK